MYRILFPVILLLCGNNLLGQTILADNLLQKIIDDPDNQFDHLRALEKEYSAFNEAALIPHLKKAEKVILDHLDPRSQIDAFRSLGALCWSKNFSAEALSFYDRSIEISLSIEEFLEAGIGYWQLAGHFSEREKYPQALERVYKANEYFILSGDMMWQAKARSMAASIGYRAHNYILSVEEIEKSLLLFRSLEPSQFNHADSIEFMSTLNTCGLSYAGLRNEEKAIACYAEAEKVAVLLNNKFWIGLINGNKGHVFAARGDIDRAIRSLEIDLRSSLAFKQYRSAMSSSISLSDLCIRKNQWTAAKRYLDTARQLMKTVKASRASQERYLKNLSKVLAYEGKDEQAYATLLRWKQSSRMLGSPESKLLLISSKSRARLNC